MNEEEIKTKGWEFARENKEKIAKELTDKVIYLPDEFPASVFMAGSPGAGKTEYSRNLVEILQGDDPHKIIRIDGDELRDRFPGYTGGNSFLFQSAVSILVEKIHDLALKNKQSFLLDGTLFRYEKAAHNINRSLQKNRVVFIFYLYQKPEVAWKFTQAREIVEGRNIPKDAFITQFLHSRETVKHIQKDFGDKVVIYLVKKNFEDNTVEATVKITKNGKQIDDYLGEGYTRDDLEKLL